MISLGILSLYSSQSKYAGEHTYHHKSDNGGHNGATVDSLDIEVQVDASKAQKVLGMKFRGLEEMVVSMGESMIELGML